MVYDIWCILHGILGGFQKSGALLEFPNCRALIIRTPQDGPYVYMNSHVVARNLHELEPSTDPPRFCMIIPFSTCYSHMALGWMGDSKSFQLDSRSFHVVSVLTNHIFVGQLY